MNSWITSQTENEGVAVALLLVCCRHGKNFIKLQRLSCVIVFCFETQNVAVLREKALWPLCNPVREICWHSGMIWWSVVAAPPGLWCSLKEISMLALYASCKTASVQAHSSYSERISKTDVCVHEVDYLVIESVTEQTDTNHFYLFFISKVSQKQEEAAMC